MERVCEEERPWAEGETDGYGASSNWLRPPQVANISNDLKWRQSFRNPELRSNVCNNYYLLKLIYMSVSLFQLCVCIIQGMYKGTDCIFSVDVGCTVILKVIYLQWSLRVHTLWHIHCWSPNPNFWLWVNSIVTHFLWICPPIWNW